MRFALIAVIAVVIAGCAGTFGQAMRGEIGSLMPGGGVTSEMVSAFCTSRAEYDAHLEDAQGTEYVARYPRVGWPACQVLAYIGRPAEQTRVETSGGVSSHWSYWETPPAPFPITPEKEARLVIVEPGPSGKGVVASVVW
jgi:hypothetical protein